MTESKISGRPWTPEEHKQMWLDALKKAMEKPITDKRGRVQIGCTFAPGVGHMSVYSKGLDPHR